MTTVLAADGGNSKTDLALVEADGRLLAFARGPQSSPHHLGEDGCMRVLASLFDRVPVETVQATHAQVHAALAENGY